MFSNTCQLFQTDGFEPYSNYEVLVVPFTAKGLANFTGWKGVECKTAESGKQLSKPDSLVFFESKLVSVMLISVLQFVAQCSEASFALK